MTKASTQAVEGEEEEEPARVEADALREEQIQDQASPAGEDMGSLKE